MSRWGGDCERMRSSGSHHHLIPNELIYHRDIMIDMWQHVTSLYHFYGARIPMYN
ncbi:hypothetical protein YC2023_025851 [Brassica napus]